MSAEPQLLPGDRGLLEGFRRGEPAALTALYRAYAPRVLRMLSRGLWMRTNAGLRHGRVSPLDLEAALQETFARAFGEKARLAYDGLRPFEPWLFSLARAAAVDTMRAAGRVAQESVALEEAPSVEASAEADQPDPETAALDRELAALVQRFLAGLEADDRRLLELRFGEGLSQDRAALAVGLTRQRVRTREAALRAGFTRFLRGAGWLSPASAAAGGRSVRSALLALSLVLGPAAAGPPEVPPCACPR